MSDMYVVKRDGRHEDVHFDKITQRIQALMTGLDVKPVMVAKAVIQGLYPGVSTQELDVLAYETAAGLVTEHPDYSQLAARIAISNLKKKSPYKFSECMLNLNTNLRDDFLELVKKHGDQLDEAINDDRDNEFTIFGFKTLENSYLKKSKDGKYIEHPQHLFMRTALEIHRDNIEAVIETYDLMSSRVFTHATPTLFNSGTHNPQLASCFLLTLKEDSIEGIYDTLQQCAQISKHAGGIGLSMHGLRGTGAKIAGTDGASTGLVPPLKVFNETARYVNQGGRRKGSFAIYLEPWHVDVEDFVELRLAHGNDSMRTRDLFLGLWIPDLFMERVQDNSMWSLMCPNECPGLQDCYGDDFKALYEKYESEGRFKRQIKAADLLRRIVKAQIESGMPYMLYKDACNKKSNQKNLGTIRSSNLCCEIVEYTSKDEIAVCNLASINLSSFVDPKGAFNFKELSRIAGIVTKNLNKVIDLSYYPVKEARNSNMKHRPIGIGVQGLADAFLMMDVAFDSDEAVGLQAKMFEAIQYGALDASSELAKVDGTYETFEGSPASKGILQHDMWENAVLTLDWTLVREKIALHGLRNSLLTAPMPTASTSQILGNNEQFEPFTSNLYTRRVLSGEYIVLNKHLVKDLNDLGLWTDEMRRGLVANRGSIQITENMAGALKELFEQIPVKVREKFKTVWEMKQKRILDMAAARGPFIDQSNSMNIFMTDPTVNKVVSMHIYGWKRGLKTGQYYLRTRNKANPVQFTVDKKFKAKKVMDCTEDICTMCSS